MLLGLVAAAANPGVLCRGIQGPALIVEFAAGDSFAKPFLSHRNGFGAMYC